MSDRVAVQRLRGRVPQDVEMRLALQDGRGLHFGRGMIDCNYGFVRAAPSVADPSEDRVAGWLEVGSSDGDVYRLEREIRAHLLLELVRLGEPAEDSAEFEPFIAGLKCWHDRRRYIPTIACGPGGSALAVAYFAEGLAPELDLLRGPSGLIIRVHAIDGGGIGGAKVPKIVVSTLWGPRLILWPSLIHDAIDPTMPPVTVRKIDGLREAQPLVRVE